MGRISDGVGLGIPLASVVAAVVAVALGLGFVATAVEGRFVVEKNSLMVISPSELRGKHDSAIGNFGIPQYGGSMAGTVVYPKGGNNADACEEFAESFRAKPGALPNFLLIDRGGNVIISSFSFFFFCVKSFSDRIISTNFGSELLI